MQDIDIFLNPTRINLDQIGSKRLVDISDGDTPNIRMNVRMLSIDTPEKRPTGRIRNLAELDSLFNDIADWIEAGTAPMSASLAAHLHPRLKRAQPATTHTQQGKKASEEHNRIVDEKLTRPTGSKRSLFVRVAYERFDRYGRLLAYVAPNYSKKERESMSRRDRAIFNFLMVEGGGQRHLSFTRAYRGNWTCPCFGTWVRRRLRAARASGTIH